MWDGFNQRKFPRLVLHCEIVINPAAGDSSIMTKTENVGLGGVCVIQNQPLERFSQCQVRLELDKSLPAIECHGKICWIIPSRKPLSQENRFDTGIEFLDLKDEDRDRLRDFIQERLPKKFQSIV